MGEDVVGGQGSSLTLAQRSLRFDTVIYGVVLQVWILKYTISKKFTFFKNWRQHFALKYLILNYDNSFRFIYVLNNEEMEFMQIIL